VEEDPTFELDTQDKLDQWMRFKRQSYFFYSLMAKQGNQLFFNNKVDKRGRIYACGYHINPMGAPFKKACLELAHEILVEGVPT
jgi:DNA-directed RNA polymerase